jgi:3',5'-cyclic AMP phosphodiesterase CpdA
VLNPYRRYQAVETMIERPLELPGLVVVPLKTTARFQLRNLSHGRVSRSGLRAALTQLAGKPAGTVALVACHHPLVRTGFTGHGDTEGGAEALARLAAAGADAVLSGHVHDAFDVAHHDAGRVVRLIGAGTLSERLRTTPPSFNRLTVANGRIEVAVAEMPR